MRVIHLVSAVAATCLSGLATDAYAAGADLACGPGYHPDRGGNCQPDIAEVNRYCPEGAVFHPWINGGWYCEYPESPASHPAASYAALTHEHPALRTHLRPHAARRASAPAQPGNQVRSIPAQTEALAVPINSGSSAPLVVHGGGAGGGGGGGWSDRRLKRDIVRMGASPSGLPIYAFQYVWGGPRYIGVMAQDLLKVRPDAVILDKSGYYKVDYSRIDVEMREESLAA